MHRRALSQRHILWKVGQNKKCSGNYQWIFLSTQCTMTHNMWDLASQRPLKTVLFSWLPSCVYNYCGWWLHAFKLATVQYISRPKIVAELKRQLAGPSWLRMCCKKPRREQFLETSSASLATWIKTLAYRELRQWGWWPRPGYSQSFQRW